MSDLATLPYSLGRAITEHPGDAEFEHAIRSVDAFLGAAGVPMSRVANWAEFVWLAREMFDARTNATDIPAIVRDLHRAICGLSKKQRRKLRRENAARLKAWAMRPIYDRARTAPIAEPAS